MSQERGFQSCGAFDRPAAEAASPPVGSNAHSAHPDFDGCYLISFRTTVRLAMRPSARRATVTLPL